MSWLTWKFYIWLFKRVRFKGFIVSTNLTLSHHYNKLTINDKFIFYNENLKRKNKDFLQHRPWNWFLKRLLILFISGTQNNTLTQIKQSKTVTREESYEGNNIHLLIYTHTYSYARALAYNFHVCATQWWTKNRYEVSGN